MTCAHFFLFFFFAKPLRMNTGKVIPLFIVSTNLYVFWVSDNFVHRIHFNFFVIELSIVGKDVAWFFKWFAPHCSTSVFFTFTDCITPYHYNIPDDFFSICIVTFGSGVSWYSTLVPRSSYHATDNSKRNNMDYTRNLVVRANRNFLKIVIDRKIICLWSFFFVFVLHNFA